MVTLALVLPGEMVMELLRVSKVAFIPLVCRCADDSPHVVVGPVASGVCKGSLLAGVHSLVSTSGRSERLLMLHRSRAMSRLPLEVFKLKDNQFVLHALVLDPELVELRVEALDVVVLLVQD